jgi:hypothetical protein
MIKAAKISYRNLIIVMDVFWQELENTWLCCSILAAAKGEEEMKTLIFDKGAGRLQWISNREIFWEALKEFDAAVGIDPHNKGVNPADWVFCRVTDEKAKEIADWHEHGSPARLVAA